jgi:hypothetical protein
MPSPKPQRKALFTADPQQPNNNNQKSEEEITVDRERGVDLKKYK